MTIIEAYREVTYKQREIAEVLEQYRDSPRDEQIKAIAKNVDILTKSKAARIVAVHRVISNKGARSPFSPGWPGKPG